MTEIERGITYNCRLDEVDKFWNDVQEADINYMNRGVASASFTSNEIFLPKKKVTNNSKEEGRDLSNFIFIAPIFRRIT